MCMKLRTRMPGAPGSRRVLTLTWDQHTLARLSAFRPKNRVEPFGFAQGGLWASGPLAA